MDFKMQQNFHPVWSDLQPLPPGRRQLPLQPTPWLKLESSLFLTLFLYFLRELVDLRLWAMGWVCWVMGDPCKVGRQAERE